MIGDYNRGITGCDGECGCCNHTAACDNNPNHEDIEFANDDEYNAYIESFYDFCGHKGHDFIQDICMNSACDDYKRCLFSYYDSEKEEPNIETTAPELSPSFIMHFIDGTRPNKDAV